MHKYADVHNWANCGDFLLKQNNNTIGLSYKEIDKPIA